MKHLDQLETWFESCPGAVIAFSAGVDSSLVAVLARRFLPRDQVLAVQSASPSLKRSDLQLGVEFCREHDIPMEVIETQELQLEAYRSNPANRCYFCKQTLYKDLSVVAVRRASTWILNGTNTDDLGDYRPGLTAASEFLVRSPLAECGLDKAAVRRLARDLNLTCSDKPASPCLSSRIPYGQEVTEEKLRRIETAEALLQTLGFPESRVRHVQRLAVIEVPSHQVSELIRHRNKLNRQLAELGFEEVQIDLEGLVSGKLNRALTNSGRQAPGA